MTKQNSDVIFRLFKTMTEGDIVCAYHGDFNYNIVNGLLNTVKSDLSNSDHDRRVVKKTYNVLVECLENIHKHATKNRGVVKNEGIFILTNLVEGLSITIGNLINIEETAELQYKIDQANSMNRDELKERYKAIISNGSISDKGGAGLGIIDIALKADTKLEYCFHEYNNSTKFFTLDITIKTKN